MKFILDILISNVSTDPFVIIVKKHEGAYTDVAAFLFVCGTNNEDIFESQLNVMCVEH